jgi:hypothetical protein
MSKEHVPTYRVVTPAVCALPGSVGVTGIEHPCKLAFSPGKVAPG